jgi:hypothetical protein
MALTAVLIFILVLVLLLDWAIMKETKSGTGLNVNIWLVTDTAKQILSKAIIN